MDVVLIPAYEPDEQLIPLVRQLTENDLSVLVVDDGSGKDYWPIFDQVRESATVLTQQINGGKGSALKTGLQYIWDHIPECEHVITCDADGQHTVKDVLRVRHTLHAGNSFVLSVRTPQKEVKVPLRSKVGNTLSRVVYTLLTNRYLPDNQSGLRGFARDHIDWMRQVEKNNYDYEMNVLYYAAKKGLQITTLPIETIYINDNASSHFNPIKDTLRIYKSLFWLARSSFFALLASEIGVIVASFFDGKISNESLWITLPLIGAGSLVVNTALSQFWVFRKIRCADHMGNLIYTIFVYFLYTMGCMLLRYMMPWMPLWLAFNIMLIVALPIRYFFHKCLHLVGNSLRRT